MKAYFFILFVLLGLGGFAQFAGGNGSGYTSGGGGGVGVCNSSGTVVVNACDNYMLPSGSQTVTASGVYQDTIPNLAGCDSFLTIQLTVVYSSSATLAESGCDGIVVNGISYDSSGTYIQFLTNAAGCDSVLTLQLNIQQNALNDSVSLAGNTLTAVQGGAVYQWLDCGNGFAAIGGQTGQSFTPGVTGNYAVVVSNGLCSDTSDCVGVTVVGVEGQGAWGNGQGVRVHPNPTAGMIRLDLGSVMEEVTVTVYDGTGKRVGYAYFDGVQVASLHISGADGIYLIGIQAKDQPQVLMRVIKSER
jgi:hypothetical protein